MTHFQESLYMLTDLTLFLYSSTYCPKNIGALALYLIKRHYLIGFELRYILLCDSKDYLFAQVATRLTLIFRLPSPILGLFNWNIFLDLSLKLREE